MIEKLITKNLDDIIISGYTELGEIPFFSQMMWWVYLKFEDDSFILLTSNDGNISAKFVDNIKCNFDIEDEDIFTISSYSKQEYGKISKLDLFHDTSHNLVSVGVQTFDDNYILFDAICIDGFNIKEHLDRNSILSAQGELTLKTIG